MDAVWGLVPLGGPVVASPGPTTAVRGVASRTGHRDRSYYGSLTALEQSEAAGWFARCSAPCVLRRL